MPLKFRQYRFPKPHEQQDFFDKCFEDPKIQEYKDCLISLELCKDAFWERGSYGQSLELNEKQAEIEENRFQASTPREMENARYKGLKLDTLCGDFLLLGECRLKEKCPCNRHALPKTARMMCISWEQTGRCDFAEQGLCHCLHPDEICPGFMIGRTFHEGCCTAGYKIGNFRDCKYRPARGIFVHAKPPGWYECDEHGNKIIAKPAEEKPAAPTRTQTIQKIFEEERSAPNEMLRHIEEMITRAAKLRLSGDDKSAEAFEEAAKSLKDKVPGLQDTAGKRIFVRVNDVTEITCDLHGLFVQEAVSQAGDAIRQAQDMGNNRRVKLTLVTGRGAHSAASAKIKPAIKRFLESKSLNFVEEIGAFKLTYQPFVL